MNAHKIRLAIAVCSLGAAMPATAADIRAQLTPELISNHCRTHGIGSEIEGTFMLPSGRVTERCSAPRPISPPPRRRHQGDTTTMTISAIGTVAIATMMIRTIRRMIETTDGWSS